IGIKPRSQRPRAFNLFIHIQMQWFRNHGSILYRRRQLAEPAGNTLAAKGTGKKMRGAWLYPTKTPPDPYTPKPASLTLLKSILTEARPSISFRMNTYE